MVFKLEQVTGPLKAGIRTQNETKIKVTDPGILVGSRSGF